MLEAVAREQHDARARALEDARAQGAGGLAEGGVGKGFRFGKEEFGIVESGAADDADELVHVCFSPRICRGVRR